VTIANHSTETAIDPIFAAIARHQETSRRFALAVRVTDEVEAAQDGRIITQAERDEDEAALAADDAAEAALFNTQPTTEAGFRALRAYERRAA
jgi:hypothetical protein